MPEFSETGNLITLKGKSLKTKRADSLILDQVSLLGPAAMYKKELL